VEGVEVSRGRQTYFVINVESRQVERDIGCQEVVIVYIPQVLMMLL
jgi:hypothetical protein